MNKTKKVELKDVPIENKAHDGRAYFEVVGGSALQAVKKFTRDQDVSNAAVSKFIKALSKEFRKVFKPVGIKLANEYDTDPVAVDFICPKATRPTNDIRDELHACMLNASLEFIGTWGLYYSYHKGRLTATGKTRLGKQMRNKVRRLVNAVPNPHTFIEDYLGVNAFTTKFIRFSRVDMRTGHLHRLAESVYVVSVPIDSPEPCPVKIEGVTGLKRLKMSQYWRLVEKVES